MLNAKYLEFLHNGEDTFAIFEALDFFKETKEDEAIPSIQALLKHSDKGVQQAAIDTLIQYNSDEIFQSSVKLLYDNDATLRNMGIEILMEMDTAHYDKLIPLLDDNEDDIRKFAIDIICPSGRTEFVPALLKRKNDTNANVRSALAEALGQLEVSSEPVLTTLIDMLDDAEDWVKFSAIEAVGKLDSEKVTPLLLEKYDSLPDYLQQMVLDAFGRIGTPEVVNLLLSSIESGELDKEGMTIAVQSLISIAYRYNVNVFDKIQKAKFTSIISEQLQTMSDQNELLNLLDVICGLKIKTCIPDLIRMGAQMDPIEGYELLEKISETIIRIHDDCIIIENLDFFSEEEKYLAITYLGDLHSVKAAPYLLRSFRTVTQNNRRAIVKAIGNIQAPENLLFLIDCLKDEDGKVRRIAAVALGKSGSADAFNALLEIFKQGDYDDVMEATLQSLLQIDPKDTENELFHLVYCENKTIQITALKGLAEIGSERSIAIFIELMSAPDPETRKLCLEALCFLKYTENPDIFINALNDIDDNVVVTAIKTIGELDIKEGYPFLLRYFHDDNDWIQFQAIQSVGILHTDESVPHFIELFYKSSDQVKNEILTVLSTFHFNQEAYKLIVQASQDDEFSIAQNAQDILIQNAEFYQKFSTKES